MGGWREGRCQEARGEKLGGMLQGTETAGRSFKRRPLLRMGCCPNDDDDDDDEPLLIFCSFTCYQN
jgi:hypothetical protein